MSRLVYISGALTKLSDAQRTELTRFYEELGEICKQSGFEPYIPHIQTGWGAVEPDLTPKRVDRVDRLGVTQASLVIAYVGVPSIGVGIEVELAYHANKPVVLLYERSHIEQRTISRLVLGSPGVVSHLIFEDFEDAKAQLRTFLAEFRKQIADEKLPPALSP